MRDFARLFAAIDGSTATNAKVAALEAYFRGASAADAAWALYFLGGAKPRQVVPVKVLRRLACEEAGISDWLFEECYQAVGDLAETIAHVLPDPGGGSDASLMEWVEQRLLALRGLDERALDDALRAAWRELDATGRFLWNKLITGGFRVGVSKLLVTRAVAAVAGVDPKVIAERLAGEWQPSPERYMALLAPAGTTSIERGQPYPFYLAHALQTDPATLGAVEDWIAEWKWDGIRAQLLRRDGETFLWSRGDELITERFPEIAAIGARLAEGTALDGEVLAWRGDAVLPFAILQQRIGRKTIGPKVLADAPVAFIAYDLLQQDGVDLRGTPLAERRDRLEALVARLAQPHLRLSTIVTASNWEALAERRAESRARKVEGLMLKHRDSRYGAGRVKGASATDAWWKWKIDPYSVDAVLVYAQRGHGRRASLYTDYTFAVWNAGELVPFAKAYSGLTDEEFREVDRFIQKNTVEKFGPVRSVTPQLVFEIGFEGIARSPRHKSGIAVRFPRMLRMRPDKQPADADSIDTLRAMLGS
jgi:DNA ligase 1